MKTYMIMIKSHSEAPDYEDEVDAESKEQAIRIFTYRINSHLEDRHWKESEIAPHVMELEVETKNL